MGRSGVAPIWIIVFIVIGLPVIALLGFMFLGPSYVRSLNSSQCEAHLKMIHASAEAYKNEHGRYPNGIRDLTANGKYLSGRIGCPAADLRDT